MMTPKNSDNETKQPPPSSSSSSSLPVVGTAANDDDDDDDDDEEHDHYNDTWLDRSLDYLREHRLSPMVEIIVSWHVVVVCLAYYGYGYLRSWWGYWTIRTTTDRHHHHHHHHHPTTTSTPPPHGDNRTTTLSLVPLTTVARRRRRRQQLGLDNNDNSNCNSWLEELCQLSDDDDLVAKVRGDLSLRRLVSRFMTTTPTKVGDGGRSDDDGSSTNDQNDNVRETLRSRLRDVWPRLLAFPPVPVVVEEDVIVSSSSSVTVMVEDPAASSTTTTSTTTTTTAPSASKWSTSTFDISLIMPAYGETTERIVGTLDVALCRCANNPQRVQVIIVHVDGTKEDDQRNDNNTDDDDATITTTTTMMIYNRMVQAGHTTAWGDVTVVRYRNNTHDDATTTTTTGGGRGPAQNYGASLARGVVLTFLHADTVVPIHWDRKVRATLLLVPPRGQPENGPLAAGGRFCSVTNNNIVQACAFTFGHNTDQLDDDHPYPWGIRAVWLLGNLRAYLFRLPYGDHVISIPTAYFRYLGGFPNQPIMEDYDLMDLLRQRAAVLPREGIRIIPPPTAQCSVRRWQRWGTVYVTLVNALLVHRYTQGGWTADDVYEYYYERPTSTSTMTKSRTTSASSHSNNNNNSNGKTKKKEKTH